MRLLLTVWPQITITPAKLQNLVKTHHFLIISLLVSAMPGQEGIVPMSLLDLLRNTLILSHVSPYLGVTGLVSLAATSTSFRDLVYNTPYNFRHVKLTKIQSCLDFIGPPKFYPNRESPSDNTTLSPDDFYAQPIRKVLYSLQWHNVLQGVRTLILDRLAVPSALVREILCEDAYNVRILSLRDVKEIGDEKLMQILRYIMRPTRPEGTPKLKALYYFTPLTQGAGYTARDLFNRSSQGQVGVTNSLGAQLGAGSSSSGALHREMVRSSWHQRDQWYSATGEVFKPDANIDQLWASLIEACEGSIAFDAVLCRRHGAKSMSVSAEDEIETMIADQMPRLATISLGGCQKCGACPESPAYPGTSPESHLPLLAPPPLHSSSAKAAQLLDTRGLPHPPFIARCRQCLKDRWCDRCNAWWCETCYKIPKKRTATSVNVTPMGAKNFDCSIKVNNGLCAERCLMDELLNGVGEGGMWG